VNSYKLYYKVTVRATENVIFIHYFTSTRVCGGPCESKFTYIIKFWMNSQRNTRTIDDDITIKERQTKWHT